MLSLVLLSALLLVVSGQREIVNILRVDNGAADGVFFREEYCPDGTFAFGFQLLVGSKINEM